MKYTKETVYFDINTKAKVNKLHSKFKKYNVKKSHIVRKAIYMTPFDKMVEELNNELGIT